MAALPDRCEVVVVGGGVIGVSVAHHLAEAGIQDVVLLERKELTSGTTWHAAGLVGQLRTSINMTQLARYTSQLYRGLEEERPSHRLPAVRLDLDRGHRRTV